MSQFSVICRFQTLCPYWVLCLFGLYVNLGTYIHFGSYFNFRPYVHIGSILIIFEIFNNVNLVTDFEIQTNFPKPAFSFASRTLEKLNLLFLVVQLSYESSSNSEPNRNDYPFEYSASPGMHWSMSPPARFSTTIPQYSSSGIENEMEYFDFFVLLLN